MVFKVPHTLGANHPEPVLGKRFKYPKGILGIFSCTIFRIIFVLVHLFSSFRDCLHMGEGGPGR